MTKAVLNSEERPRQWYNLAADLPGYSPPSLSPGKMESLFPACLIEQEMSRERWIRIPEGILQLLCRRRPSPLYRAAELEKALRTPARIYFKDESCSAAGTGKSYSALAQAWYNKEAAAQKLTAETASGQWGNALAHACSQTGLECRVYMTRVSYDQKPYRKVMMQTWGADCIPSPSGTTEIGRQVLREKSDTPGTSAVAVSEAVDTALKDSTGVTRYAPGSIMNFVMLHQTLSGQEARAQLALFGEKKADIVIGCAGGGASFAGLAFPFLADKIAGTDMDIISVESRGAPVLTQGCYRNDTADTAGLTPERLMYTLGNNFIPPPIHAGGLRRHCTAPLVSEAAHQGLITPRAVNQVESFEAAVSFARSEGFIVSPETAYTLAAVVQEALKAKEEEREKVIVFALSGHGLMDLKGYQSFFAAELPEYQ